MLRQVSRRKARWLEAQSRRNMRIHAIRKCGLDKHRNALLFAIQISEYHEGTVKVPTVYVISQSFPQTNSPILRSPDNYPAMN